MYVPVLLERGKLVCHKKFLTLCLLCLPLMLQWLEFAGPRGQASSARLATKHKHQLFVAQRHPPFVLCTKNLREYKPLDITAVGERHIIGIQSAGESCYIAVHDPHEDNTGVCNSILMLDEPNRSFQPVDNGTAPGKQTYFSVGILDRLLFLFGGRSSEELTDVLSFNLDTHEWQSSPHDLPAMPFSNRCCQSMRYEDGLILGGGIQRGKEMDGHRCVFFHPNCSSGRLEWSDTPALPNCPSRAGIFYAHSHMFQVGGVVNDQASLKTCSAFRINLSADSPPTRVPLPSLKEDCHCPTVIEYGGALLVIGGRQRRTWKSAIYAYPLDEFVLPLV